MEDTFTSDSSNSVTFTLVEEEKRNIPSDERNQADDSNFAGPGRSFPILKPADVMAAVHSIGRSNSPSSTIKAGIIRIAKRKGGAFLAALPDEWKQEIGTKEIFDAIAHEHSFGQACPFGCKEIYDANLEVDEDKVGKRMSYQQVGKLRGALDTIKNLFHWASYEEDQEQEIEFDKSSGFKVIETSSGPRWLSYSSNAFKDLDQELFTTKALEEAVSYADQTGDRGPLRIFHVLGADIGDADYQAVADRFLIESGTFRDNELGKKAIDYFKTHPEDQFQVSIGFQYKMGDERDGVYDWLRIRERSVTPFGDAANPFTSFAIGEIGGEQMDERKMKMLADIFGQDLASKIVGEAETKSKDLEMAGVAFKSTGNLLEDLKSTVAAMEEGSQRTVLTSLVEKYDKAKKPPMDAEDDPAKGGDSGADEDTEDAQGNPKKGVGKKKELEVEVEVPDAFQTALEALTERINSIADVKKTVDTLAEEIIGIKEKLSNAPRGSSLFRASEANDNVLDPDRIKELVGDQNKVAPNPARAYVEDLISLGATH